MKIRHTTFALLMSVTTIGLCAEAVLAQARGIAITDIEGNPVQ